MIYLAGRSVSSKMSKRSSRTWPWSAHLHRPALNRIYNGLLEKMNEEGGSPGFRDGRRGGKETAGAEAAGRSDFLTKLIQDRR